MTDSFPPPQHLVDIITNKNAVLIIGAGVSIAASGNTSEGSWKGLVYSGVEWCSQWVPNLRDNWRESMIKLLDSGDTIDLLGVASQLTDRMPNGEFLKWLNEKIGGLKLTVPTIIKLLYKLNIPILTTNYDTLIEEATGLPSISWKQPDQIIRILRRETQGVVHLHGFWRDPESIVLGLRSYQSLIDDKASQALQQGVKSLRNMIFVGCGATVDDPNFHGLLSWARTVFKGSTSQRHYYLCLKEEEAFCNDQFQPNDMISVVSYGTKYTDLERYLAELAVGLDEPSHALSTLELKKDVVQLSIKRSSSFDEFIKLVNDLREFSALYSDKIDHIDDRIDLLNHYVTFAEKRNSLMYKAITSKNKKQSLKMIVREAKKLSSAENMDDHTTDEWVEKIIGKIENEYLQVFEAENERKVLYWTLAKLYHASSSHKANLSEEELNTKFSNLVEIKEDYIALLIEYYNAQKKYAEFVEAIKTDVPEMDKEENIEKLLAMRSKLSFVIKDLSAAISSIKDTREYKLFRTDPDLIKTEQERLSNMRALRNQGRELYRHFVKKLLPNFQVKI